MKKTCPKCQGGMAQGFMLDHTYGGQTVGEWHAGAPRASFWVGTQVPRAPGVPVGAWRCGGCGFLEFYAGPEYAAAADRK